MATMPIMTISDIPRPNMACAHETRGMTSGRTNDDKQTGWLPLLFALVGHGRGGAVVRLPFGIEPFLEGVDTFAQGEHQAGETMAKENEDDHRYDDQLGLANTHETKEGGHSIALALK